jgi:hypothetical protein
VRTDADIDLNGPQISGVTVQSSYEDAVVAWNTSELSDALVQFGESSFLGRTAYLADPTREHKLSLTGLKPDRPYYFQVVSRDRAGNTVVDDSGGHLYVFRTLTPLFAPWFDSLETGATNWTVTAEAGSDTRWSLGVPQNGRESAAHSPSQAWGSNLEGDPISYSVTSLTSPPVDLTGGRYATVRFWQSYDFGADASLESGKLLVVTNTQSADEILLDTFEGATPGWQEAIYDLTRYAGHVIQLIWRYEFATLDSPDSRPGWLIDDINLTVTNSVSGQIQVSNNLASASFTLTGPISRSGQGWSSTFTNAPPGEYVIEFGDVPYYQTPAPQTNVLADGALLFVGNYQMEDANGNGIADPWELQYLGGLSTTDLTQMDRDGDGMSDAAEFVAGTDPTDANSSLVLSVPVPLANGMCRIQWTAVPRHAYRVLSSNDAINWSARSAWIRAGSTQLSYTIPGANLGAAFFRIEVSP